MKPVLWTVSGVLAFILLFPLSLILLVTTIAAPAVAARCTPPAATSGMPQPGNPRQASLTNPPSDIPPAMLTLYQSAAAAYHVPWTLLAGIGMEETDHGRNNTTSSAGAQGLMQFIPATFASFGVDGNADGTIAINDDADSLYSAAHYLVASGAHNGPDGIRQALYAYNHALWYVNDVLYYAAAYAGGDITENPCVTADTQTGTGGGVPVVTGAGSTATVINAAMSYLGTRYSWGGGTASGPSYGICCSPHGQDARNILGFDCSGLVLYAYAQIGVRLDHLADTIAYRSGGQIIPRDFTQMLPGDVIGFAYRPGGHVFHVGIYLGNGQMVDSDSSGVGFDSLTTGYYSRLAWQVVRFAV